MDNEARRSVSFPDAVRWLSKTRDEDLFVVYEPGNGTRYRLFFNWMPALPEESRGYLPGIEDRTMCVVTLLGPRSSRGHSAVLNAYGPPLEWQELAEGLELREPDARVLTELVGLVLHRSFEPVGPPGETAPQVLFPQAPARG